MTLLAQHTILLLNNAPYHNLTSTVVPFDKTKPRLFIGGDAPTTKGGFDVIPAVVNPLDYRYMESVMGFVHEDLTDEAELVINQQILDVPEHRLFFAAFDPDGGYLDIVLKHDSQWVRLETDPGGRYTLDGLIGTPVGDLGLSFARVNGENQSESRRKEVLFSDAWEDDQNLQIRVLAIAKAVMAFF